MNDNELSEILKSIIHKVDYYVNLDMMYGNVSPNGDDEDVLIAEALEKLRAREQRIVREARLNDNHDWDSNMFDPIIVCRRCGTTYQLKGNKVCTGRMAKVTTRANSQQENT